eukprot:TRINITY_DN6079_c0_g1_i1.p1 TRINITY_DN6079_c0_g1~~TRINITY_DN6079_c0_g1_i1.p1  ORF type:complete len:119 (-),score=28.59 TRINITY_DN6079_c0_g1_i1:35-391(-)
MCIRDRSKRSKGLASEFGLEVERFRIENQELKEQLISQRQQLNEESNILEYSEETYESELPTADKKMLGKAFELKPPLDEKGALLRRIAQLETEQENCKKIIKAVSYTHLTLPTICSV